MATLSWSRQFDLSDSSVTGAAGINNEPTCPLVQVILIGDEIEITVLDITGNQLRIGIAAPEDVPMHREEIYQLIADERESA